MTRKFNILHKILISIVCSAISVSAWAYDREEAAEFYESGLEHFFNGNFVGAELEFKNALQLDPQYLPARIELGKTRLHVGNGEGAEKELREAIRLGADKNLVMIPLLDALMLQGRYKNLLQEAEKINDLPGLQAKVFNRMGLAEIELQNYQAAEAFFDKTLSIEPENIKALAGKAMQSLRMGDLKTATERAEEIVIKSPSDVEGWLVKGAIAVYNADLSAAQRHYEHVLKLDEHHLSAVVRVASLLLDQQAYEQAIEFIQTHRERFDWDPQLPYFLMLAHSALGNEEASRAALNEAHALTLEITQELMSANRNIKEMVAKISSLHGDHVIAVELFEQLSVFEKLDDVNLKLYASSLLELGDADKVLVVLEPLLYRLQAEITVLIMAGEAHEMLGQDRRAIEQYRLALDGEEELAVAMRIANIYQRLNDLLAGIALLEKMQEKYPDNVPLKGKLSLFYLRQGNAEKAMAILEPVLKTHGDKPDVLNQLGGILVAQGKIDEAREIFNRLVNDYKGFVQAVFNLAKLEQFTGNSEQAVKYYREILEEQPENVMAAFELAKLEQQMGNLQAAIQRLESLYLANIELSFIAQELVEYYLLNKQLENAYDLALKISTEAQTNPQYKELLGRVYMLQKKRDKALKVLIEAAQQAEGNPDLLVKIARPLLAMNDDESGRAALSSALEFQPKHFSARAMLIRLELSQNRLENAREQLAILLKLNPDSLSAYDLLGDIERQSGDDAKAAEAYAKAGNGSQVIVKRIGALKRSGQQSRVQSVLNEVINDNNSRVARMLLAQEYQDSKQLAAAAAQYRKVLEISPNDLSSLNNLALLELDDNPPKALEYAIKAYDIAAENASIADTYAWVLIQNGEINDGVRILRDTSVRQSRSPLILYHLAYGLAAQGRNNQAIGELEKASRLEMSADLKEKVQRLMNKLN